MIEVTFRIESLDYTDKLDSQLPLVLEALSQSGNINPVLKLACNTPEASSRIVKGILRTMSQDQKQRLATKIVNANREKLMRKLNEYAAGKGASTCTSATAPPPSVRSKRIMACRRKFACAQVRAGQQSSHSRAALCHLPQLYFTIPRVYKSTAFCLRIGCAIRKKGGTAMILALAGNPNCGKTTLFNALTGANARTGNFPGVTVTRSEAVCRARPDVTLVDLPGEARAAAVLGRGRVTRAYLLGGEADAIISIADATPPARSLYLTLQLLELGVPVAGAERDAGTRCARAAGRWTQRGWRALGIPVVPASAALGEGSTHCSIAAVRAWRRPAARPVARAGVGGADLHYLDDRPALLADGGRAAGLPPVLAATQWLDGAHGDHAPEAARQAVGAWCAREHARDEALPTARFAQVDRLTRFFTLPQTLPGHRRSARIDRVLTGRYTAYPAMAASLGRVFI